MPAKHQRKPTNVTNTTQASIDTKQKPESESFARPASPTGLKVLRELDHGRWKTRKAVESKEIKCKREARATGFWTKPCSCCVGYTPTRGRGISKGTWGVRTDYGDARDWADLTEPDVTEIVAEVENRSEVVEVSLADLVKPGKIRKQHSKGTPAGDFEFVPNIKSVIVLDDQVNDEPEVDEPWDFVGLDEVSPNKPAALSYAEIAANAL